MDTELFVGIAIGITGTLLYNRLTHKFIQFSDNFSDKLASKIASRISQPVSSPKSIPQNDVPLRESVEKSIEEVMDYPIEMSLPPLETESKIIKVDLPKDSFLLSDFLDTDTIKKITSVLSSSDEASIKINVLMGDMVRDSGLIHELFCGPVRLIVSGTKELFNFLAYEHPLSKEIPQKFNIENFYDTSMVINDIVIPVRVVLFKRDMDLPFEERSYTLEIQARND